MKQKYLIRYRWNDDETRFFETHIECEDLRLGEYIFEFLKEKGEAIIQKIVRNG